jgi:hypothetical protein
LNAEAVPYIVATEQDIAAMGSRELLVVPDVRYLSQSLYDAIAAAGARGVKILPLGLAGLYDENGKEREKDDPIIGFKLVKNKVEDVPCEFKVALSERGIMAETQVNGRGELVLHLLRPGNASTIGELRVAVDVKRCDGAANAELFSFEDGCALEGVGTEASGRTVLTVRNFRTMCSIVFPARQNGRKMP